MENAVGMLDDSPLVAGLDKVARRRIANLPTDIDNDCGLNSWSVCLVPVDKLKAIHMRR